MDSIGLRVQALDPHDQTLVIASIAEARGETGDFRPSELDGLFHDLRLPSPRHISNVLAKLEREEFVRRGRDRGLWRLTPKGRSHASSLVTDMDLAALAAEAATSGTRIGTAPHPIILPSLAPPALVEPLRRFVRGHPFDTNVMGMTRFPDPARGDPVAPALEVAREVCGTHGLEFHLASDRAIHDDLWTNVAAHMWASRYGIAFFEDRVERGMNYNLTIEVGAMLMTGRRCALLKDKSVERMPTDLIGRIRKDVDLDDLSTVVQALHTWIRDDLSLGSCPACRS